MLHMNVALLGAPYCPCLSFKDFGVATSEGSHVAVGILLKATF